MSSDLSKILKELAANYNEGQNRVYCLLQERESKLEAKLKARLDVLAAQGELLEKCLRLIHLIFMSIFVYSSHISHRGEAAARR